MTRARKHTADDAVRHLGKALVATTYRVKYESMGVRHYFTKDVQPPRQIPLWRLKDILSPSPHATVVDLEDLIREEERRG